MRNFLYCAVTAIVCIVSAGNAAAAGGSFTRGCAARDIQIMMMLERNTIPPHVMNDAMLSMMHARMMCFDGQVMDALALYDSIAKSLGSDLAMSRQGH